MDRETRREGYLARSRAADEKAEAASDPREKEAWHNVAEGFRALARLS